MYYIYLSFIIGLSGLMAWGCKRNSSPVWWAAVVFAAPVTTPYFISKLRKNKSLVLILMFLACFCLVAVSEIFLYSHMKERYKYANLPPVTRQLIRYSEILKQTTQTLDDDLVKLEQQSKVQSKLDKVGQTIELIGHLRIAMDNNKAAIRQMVDFVDRHTDFFIKQDLQWVYEIQRFYNNRIVITHFKSLENYLDNFEALLTFCYKNFDAITKAQSSAHMKNYDQYYLRYRRAVDSHNRLNVKRIEFQNSFLKKYPEIKAYLPAKRQTEAFRLW